MRVLTALLWVVISVACSSRDGVPVTASEQPSQPLPATAMGINIGLLDPPRWDSLHPRWNHATFTNPRRQMQLLAATGARWLRISINWADLADPATGQIDRQRPEWVRLDTTLRIARDNGFSVLGVLAHHTWATPRGYPSLSAWRTYVSEVTRELTGSISHWSVWNEPNCAAFLSRGDEPVMAEDYAALIRIASPEIRAAGGVVVGGELSWWDEGNAECRAAGPFLLRTLILAGDDIDIVSITTYKSDARAVRAATDSALDVLRRVPGHRPLWLTEFGVDRPVPGDTMEADFVSDLLLHPPAGVERLFFWHGFVWNEEGRHGMIKPMDSTMGVNGRWIFSNPVPRLSYVAHAFARYGCDWRDACPVAATALAPLRLEIEGPSRVRPGANCKWESNASGGVWPYSAPVWRVAPDRIQRGRTASFVAPTKPFAVELARTDALGRTATARREISVESTATACP